MSRGRRWANLTVSQHRSLRFRTASGPNAATAIAYSLKQRGRVVRISFIVGVVLALATGPALAQAQGAGQPTLLDPHPAVPHPQLSPPPAQSAPPAAARPAPAAAAAKPAHPSAKTPRAAAKAPSTPESRSAAALALSSEPVFDEGTYQRIKEALFSYSAIQVRGGWPALPADAKLHPRIHRADGRPAAPASGHLRRSRAGAGAGRYLRRGRRRGGQAFPDPART